MEEATALKFLFDSFSSLSKSGKGMLVAYGQGLQSMEEMIRAEENTQERILIKERGGNTYERAANLQK